MRTYWLRMESLICAEDVGEFALEDGGEAEAAGHRGEGFELVLGLEVVEVADAALYRRGHSSR